jgi:MFS superfamily sulfate permease-like transporter
MDGNHGTPAGGTVYRGVTEKDTALTEPGLIVYRFDAPLVFANAAYFTERLDALIAHAGPGLKCVVLDAEAISHKLMVRAGMVRQLAAAPTSSSPLGSDP